MSLSDLILLIGMTILGGLTIMNNRSRIANRALEASVSNTQQISTFFGQLQTQALQAAEERGRDRERLDAMKADLLAEKELNRQLSEKLTAQKTENQAAMDDLRKKIGQLETEIREIRGALTKATAEKAELEQERDTLQTNYTALEASIEEKIREAVEQARTDIKFEYDAKLREYENKIQEKDAEIRDLKAKLEAKGQSNVEAT